MRSNQLPHKRRIRFYTRPPASVLALDFPISLAAPTCVGPTKNQFHSPSPRGVAIGAGRRQGFTPPRPATHDLGHEGLQAAGFGRCRAPRWPCIAARSSCAQQLVGVANQVRRQEPGELVEVECSFSFLSFSFFFQKSYYNTYITLLLDKLCIQLFSI